MIARRQLLELGVSVNDARPAGAPSRAGAGASGVFCDHDRSADLAPAAWARCCSAATARSATSRRSARRGPGCEAQPSDEPIVIAVDRQRKVVAPAGVTRPPPGRPRRAGALEPRPHGVRYEDAAIDVATGERRRTSTPSPCSPPRASHDGPARRLLAELEPRERVARAALAEPACSATWRGLLLRAGARLPRTGSSARTGCPRASARSGDAGSVGMVTAMSTTAGRRSRPTLRVARQPRASPDARRYDAFVVRGWLVLRFA